MNFIFALIITYCASDDAESEYSSSTKAFHTINQPWISASCNYKEGEPENLPLYNCKRKPMCPLKSAFYLYTMSVCYTGTCNVL
jgi:hypothetical protein